MSTVRSKLVLLGTFACIAICVVAMMRGSDGTQVAWQPQSPPAGDPATRPSIEDDDLELNLSDRLADLKFEGDSVRVNTDAGEMRVDAQTFLRAVEARQREASSRHWLLQFFDTTSFFGLIWVAIGFIGQLVFMGRMLVQWWASEKQRKSVVPTAFWWLSLAGGTMVLAYFVWRRDPVGIFGQAMGWIIYARNLWLIYLPHEQAASPATAAPDGPIAGS